jgi:ankyrin repeat protein
MPDFADEEIYQQALIKASRHGRIETLQSLLKATINDPHEKTYREALIMASEYGHVKAVRLLLDAGADVNDPETQFHGNWNDELFEPRQAQHSLALQAAADYGHSEVVRILLRAGADVHARDHDGDSALHLLSRKKCKCKDCSEIKQMLLDAGADFNF